MIRLTESTPEIYSQESRDWQLICRLYDFNNFMVKTNVDSILDIIDIDNIDSQLLELLSTKLGFFTNEYIDSESLRQVLKAFPYILKYKGSKLGIIKAINLFLRINKIDTSYYFDVTNSVKTALNDGTILNEYQVNIGLASTPRDTTVLQEVLKYILPTGYIVNYFFYQTMDEFDTFLFNTKRDMTYIKRTNNINMSLAVADNNNRPYDDYEKRIIGAIDTVEIIGADDLK